MMPGGMILFVTLEGCWNMDLTNIEFINDAAINRRRYWTNEIVKLSGHFVNDSSRVEEEIIYEVSKSGSQALLDHLRYAQPFLNHMSMIQAKKSYIQSIQTH